MDVYPSTTHRPMRTARPASLHSVITDYGDGHVVERFPSWADRQQSLVERAEQIFDSPDNVPSTVLNEENRLAGLLPNLFLPAVATIADADLGEPDGVYRPARRLMPVR